MPGRNWSLDEYRYGMNGQEKDNEVFKGAMAAEYWEYDSRIGRRWERDPITYPWQSPYATFNNNPIYYSDPSGLEGDPPVKKGDKIVINGKEEVMNAPEMEIVTNNSSPTKAPSDVLGTVNYYQFRHDDFQKRYPNQNAPNYYLEYGDKYIKRFTYDLYDQLSKDGKRWLNRARLNLQREIENKLENDPKIELNSEKFQRFAFQSHVKAYTDAGILELGLADKILILKTPDSKDLLSELGKQQAVTMAELQLKFYSENPEIFKEHVKNFLLKDMGKVGDVLIQETVQKILVTP